MVNPGDKVKIFCKEKEYVGIIIPSPHSDSIVLKLSTGYNIGILKSSIMKLEVLEVYSPKKISEEKEIMQNKSLPTIAILHTGGTIASKVDYETGGVIARYSPEELLNMFPEIKKMANIKSRLIRNMWSEDIRFAHYNILAEEIKKEIEQGARGIIITHGTDTLHYTSCALRFMFENLPIPILLIGAQRSSDRGSSDAAQNILSGVYFITHSSFCDVALCMHENSSDEWCSILPGTKSRKMHSSRRDAFRPINTTPLARVHAKEGKIEWIQEEKRNEEKREADKKEEEKKTEEKREEKEKKELILKKFNTNIRVGILFVHPNMYHEEFQFYNGFDGLIIAGTGIAGNVPINTIDEETKEHTKISEQIKRLIDHGTVVCAATQTMYGGINMNVYSTGRKMQELGILGNYCDMTIETAFIKLSFLLSNYSKEEVKRLFSQNMHNEIQDRIPAYEHFLL